MSKVKYIFTYINGEKEEFETDYDYKKDARESLRMLNMNKQEWLEYGDNFIHVPNILKIEVVGDKEKMELKLNLTPPK
ncbi:hypothetical protein [Paenibacillus sp. 276b]|uniref:hypothetical protein n=1 Tax=Paenibacillus sp. 276b TaxID=1566277 RepID=UPI000898A99C|nr:hypothetical protein [Paenibacillus sp. 276b]SEB28035.1 hypothetical protein SAMN03159332_0120 [Paenibacillus sp. 276b]